MNTFLNSKKNLSSTKIEDPLKTKFHLGGTMIIDKDFDIKNYLNVIEKQKKNRNSKKFNILNATAQYTTFANAKKPNNKMYNAYLTSTFNNIPTTNKKFKKSNASFSTDLTKKNYIKTDTNTNLDYKNYITNSNSYNFLSTKNTNNLLYNTKNNNLTKISPTQSNENFNIFKAIKEIKKTSQKPNIINYKKSSNKKLFITKIPSYNSQRPPIAYSKEYLDTVFDSKKLINRFNFRKGLEMETPDNLHKFVTNKKEISVKNNLIVLLNNETEKLALKEKDFKTRNERNKNLIDTNIKEFENYIDEHKQVCKNIESSFDSLKKENINLINELVTYRSLRKSYMDEIQKNLEQIENLRVYALFVHHSLEKDISRYEKNIFPDYRNEKLDEYDNRIEKIRNFVVNNYSFFWDNKYKEEVKEELEFLKEPDLLLHKFNEIEANIMRLLDLKENLYTEIKENEKNNKIILDDLKDRYIKAELEYKKSDKNLSYEMNTINSLKQKETDYNSEFVGLIGTLFLSIVEVFGENDKHKMNYKFILKSKIDKDNIDICLREGERLLREQEDKLNNALLAIKSYKEKDGRFFNQVMDESKQKNKMQKHLMYKKYKMDKQFETEAKVIDKTNKIVLISRKTEAPYHSPQKKVKKFINYALIKREEDEELLKYD